MVEIIVVKPGTLSSHDKRALRKAGIVPIEADDPASVRFVRAANDVEASDMLIAALKALDKADGWNDSAELFVRLMGSAAEKRQKEREDNAQ